jgi:hypothetical protein
MAMREGVDKEVSATRPVTKKQEEMLAHILHFAPDAHEMFEYEDYVNKPTVKTASALITQAIEQNADRFADREIFVAYIANRPRVQKMGAHGLFGDTDAPINLSAVQREVAEHPGNVWTNVISLRREDAARLGYDNATAWRALLREHRNKIAENMKISAENFRWYAAFHDEGSHPHIHMICYSTDPKEAYLSKQGIDGIRSCLAREIFRQDLQQIYSEQTVRRDELNRESLSVMREMCEAMRHGDCDNPEIESLLLTLADRLSKTGGKKVYGYLKADVKAMIDSVVDKLAADPRVAACYAAWYEMRNQVLQTYADKLPEPLPLSQQKEFKPLKNMIIKQAMALGDLDQQIAHADTHEHISGEASDTVFDFLAEPDLLPEIDDEMVEADDDPAYRAEWSNGYKLARHLLYGKPPDFAEARRLLIMEAENGNALAMHDLGKMYAAGIGTEQDYTKAVEWLGKAAEQGNEYAQRFLDHMDDFRNPSLLTSATWLLRSLGKLFEAEGKKLTARADHIDRKRARELHQKLQAQGHAKEDQIQHQRY